MDSDELLERVNEATRYPSIPHYHQYSASQFRLLERLVVDFDKAPGPLHVTEKLNGDGVRIILPPSTHGTAYYLGSRRVLLTSAGDLIYNPLKGIVRALRPVADELVDNATNASWLDIRQWWTVIYGELIGPGFGMLHDSPPYELADSQFRVYDIATFDASVLTMTVPEITAWRERGGLDYMAWDGLGRLLGVTVGLQAAPELAVLEGPVMMPRTLAATALWMEGWSKSETAQGASVESEGVIVRSDRPRVMAKMRLRRYRTVPAGM